MSIRGEQAGRSLHRLSGEAGETTICSGIFEEQPEMCGTVKFVTRNKLGSSERCDDGSSEYTEHWRDYRR